MWNSISYYIPGTEAWYGGSPKLEFTEEEWEHVSEEEELEVGTIARYEFGLPIFPQPPTDSEIDVERVLSDVPLAELQAWMGEMPKGGNLHVQGGGDLETLITFAEEQKVQYLEVTIPCEYKEELEDFLSKMSKKVMKVEVNFILAPSSSNKEMEAAFELVETSPNAVSITWEGVADDWESFQTNLESIDTYYQRYPQVRVNLHVGDQAYAYSVHGLERQRIKKSIDLGHSSRIGNGACITRQNDWVRLLQRMRKEGIAVEFYPGKSCKNIRIHGKEHPILLYNKYKVPIVVVSEESNGSDLSDQFYKAARNQGFRYRKLKEFARNSLRYAFFKREHKTNHNRIYVYDTHSIFIDGTNDFIPPFMGVNLPNWTPDHEASILMDESPRIQHQVQLERDFVHFEHQVLDANPEKH